MKQSISLIMLLTVLGIVFILFGVQAQERQAVAAETPIATLPANPEIPITTCPNDATCITISPPPITVSITGHPGTITLPNKTITLPGAVTTFTPPRRVITATIPGPKHTVTRTIRPPRATQKITVTNPPRTLFMTLRREPTATETVVSTVTRQVMTTSATIVPKVRTIHLPGATITVTQLKKIGVGLLSAIVIALLIFAGIYYGWHLGRRVGNRDHAAEDIKFMQSLKQHFVTRGKHRG